MEQFKRDYHNRVAEYHESVWGEQEGRGWNGAPSRGGKAPAMNTSTSCLAALSLHFQHVYSPAQQAMWLNSLHGLDDANSQQKEACHALNVSGLPSRVTYPRPWHPKS